jgi:hypothetical protein
MVAMPVCLFLFSGSSDFSVLFQVAVVVASIYWPLLLFHPELILIMDPYSPPTAPALLYVSPSIDVALHAIPSITLLLDFMFFEKKYQRKEALYGAPVVTSLATVGYGCWVEYCASYNGRCMCALIRRSYQN